MLYFTERRPKNGRMWTQSVLSSREKLMIREGITNMTNSRKGNGVYKKFEPSVRKVLQGCLPFRLVSKSNIFPS